MHRRILGVALLSLATSAAAQNAPIQKMKMTDNELTCQQLWDESQEMEKIQTAEQSSRNTASTTAVAAQTAGGAAPAAAHLAGQVMPWGGLLAGLAGNAAASVATNSAAQSQERMQQATARRDHLTQLFIGKGCKTTDIKK